MALTKVFRIELTGGADVQKDISAIKTAMSAMATAINKAKGELAALLASNGDPAAISGLTSKIAELETRLKNLSQQRKTAETDAKRQAEAEKILADVKLKEAQASKALEQAELARVQSQIAQEKELDRQIAAEQKEQRELEKKKKVLDAMPGSYNAIRNALNELRPLIQKGNESATINFGGQQLNFNEAIAEYKRLSAAEQEFRRQFVKDGTLVGEYASGIVDAFKRLNIDDIITGQVNGAKQQIGQLEQKTKELVVAYRQAQQEGSADLNKLEKEIHDNVVETQRLQQAVRSAETQLQGINGVGQQITTSISNGFKNLKNAIGQFALTYVGFFAAFNQFRKSVELNADLSDSFAQLQIYIHGSKSDVDNLVDSLKKIPTRTSLEHLVDISTIVAKKGVAKEEIAGVTQALDQLFVVLGSEAGDPHEAVSSLVKLVNVYSDDKHVTAKNIGDIGAAIQKLTSSGVATGKFLIDFAERIAGVRGITGVSIQNVLGLGAALQELGQRSETAGTAASQLVIKLFTDIPKYAGFAGKSVAEFTKTVTENPVEALIQLASGLKNNKEGLAEVAQAFDQAGIHGARVLGVLGDIAGNADYMRKRVREANAAFGDQASIVEAAAIKQNTFAATLDNIKKKFEILGTSKAFQVTLTAIASGIAFLINNIPILLVLGGSLATNWAVQNAQLILLNARLIGYNIAIGASYVAMGALTIAQTLYNGVIFIANGALTLATRALAFFGITVKATTGPLGIILTVATLLGAAFAAFGRRLEDAQNNLSEYVRLQRINAEISREATKATSEQISKLDGWVAIIKSAATSADTKRRAMEKLIELNPAFSNALKGETIDLQELDKAYGKVVQSIQAKARAEAAATLSAGKQKKVTEIAGLRQDLEIQANQPLQKKQTVFDVELTEEQKKILQQGDFLNSGAIIQFRENGAQIFAQRFDQIKKFLEKKEQEAIGVYQDYLKAQAQAEEQLTKVEESVKKSETTSETVFEAFDRLIANNGTQGDFKELLKKIEAQKKTTSVLSDEYKKLLELEKKVRELIKPKGAGGSRNPEKEKLDNALKLIDARITEQKNALEERFASGLISEKDYYIQVRDVTVKGEQDKINTIQEYQQKYKKALAKFNGELTRDIANYERNQLKAKREANQKLFDLDNKQLELLLRNEDPAAQRDRDQTLLNPDLNNEDRLNANRDYLDRLLLATIVFNQRQIEEEKKYGIKSVENAQKRKEAIEKIRKEIEANERQTPEARQKDIRDTADRQIQEIRNRVSDQTVKILESNDSATKKARKLLELEHQANKDRLAEEAAAAKIALDQAKKDKDAKLISEKEYLEKLEAYKAKEAELYKVTANEQVSSTQRLIRALKELKDQFVETGLGIKKYTDDADGDAEKQKDAIKETSDTIKSTIEQAYQNYFKNQEQRIDSDKKEQEDALDREKQRVLARASSEAEKETIERQYDKKREAIEKRAAEQKRQLALKQASIDFAVAVIKTFAQFGFPLGLIPVAALTVAYLLQRAQIQKQQFEIGGNLMKKKYAFGGNSNEVPAQGGVFGGKPHSQGGTDFEFNGSKYNAEVDELSVIRTKNAPRNKVYTITGNHTQIASALNTLGGGVSFSPGAAVSKMATGGYLGSRLKAPYFSAASYLNGGNVGGGNNTSTDIQELKQMVAQVTSAVMATDAKDVILNPRKVTKAQEKEKKDVGVATI